jgi:signal peptidase II
LVIFIVLLLDQALKFWVKTNMYLQEEIPMIGDFFRLHFIENEGMAFGMAWGGVTGKIVLTLFRIVAVIFIGYLLRHLIKQKNPFGLILSMSLILAGALGNIIDSVFYGVLFEASHWGSYQPAAFLPEGGGYAPLLQGKVVDMLYFPLFSGQYPEWVPFVGGREFLFFRPVFNLADSAITIGVIIILLFQKKFFGKKEATKETNDTHDDHAPSAQN